MTGSGPKSRDSCFVLQVATAVPQMVQQSGAALKGLGAGLTRSHMETSKRAQQWLGALKQNARKQAAVSQETLKVRITMLQPAHPPSPQNSAIHCKDTLHAHRGMPPCSQHLCIKKIPNSVKHPNLSVLKVHATQTCVARQDSHGNNMHAWCIPQQQIVIAHLPYSVGGG